MSSDNTEHAVSSDNTEHAVTSDNTEHAVTSDHTEYAVSSDNTEHAGRTVAQLTVEALRLAGVDTLYCIPGVQNDEFFDALVDAPDIRPIVCRHEQGTSYMALGHAQVTGEVSACAVVPGPGMLNAAAGLSCGDWAGGRILAVVGAIPEAVKGLGRGVLHEMTDPTAILAQVTEHAAHVGGGATAVATMQTALDTLVGGSPRPVSLEVPVDVWGQAVDGPLQPPHAEPVIADDTSIERAAAAIAAAERPLVVVGGGAQNAAAEVRALADLLQAPTFTRRQGHGVMDCRDPLWVPLTAGREFWRDADCVVAIGTRLEFPMHWGHDEAMTFVSINIDERHLDLYDLDPIALHGDAAPTLRRLLDALPLEPRASRAAEAAAARAAFDDATAHLEPQRSLLDAVRSALPDDGIVVEDVTQLGFAAHLMFEFRHPRSFLTTGTVGALGAGVAHAIGAQVGAGDRNVLGLVGDGGFGFTAMELATAAQHDVPVTILLHENGAYGNVKRIQTNRFGPDRTIASTLENPDFEAFGRSFGIDTRRADGPEALETALRDAFDHDGPSLVITRTGDVPDPWPFLRMARVRG